MLEVSLSTRRKSRRLPAGFPYQTVAAGSFAPHLFCRPISILHYTAVLT